MDIAVHSPAYLATDVPPGRQSTCDMCLSECQKWPEARILSYSRYKCWDLISCFAVSTVQLTFICQDINCISNVFSHVSVRTHRNVDLIFFFMIFFDVQKKGFCHVHVYKSREKTNKVREKKHSCLQSLFIPPV